MAEQTVRFSDGSGWQDAGSYSRAVRRAGMILVSGTTATAPDGQALFPDDTYAQTERCLQTALAAVRELGGSKQDVVRTRVMLAPGASWQDATRAHGECFAEVRPANTTVYVAGLIGAGFLVEVELDALVGS